MKLTPILASAAVVSLAALFFTSSSHGIQQPGYEQSGNNTVAYLTAGTQGPAMPSWSGPAQQTVGIPSSAFTAQQENQICSTTPIPGTPGQCSAGGSSFPNSRCSVLCDINAFCSVFEFQTGDGHCSTYGNGPSDNDYCSIMPPGVGNQGFTVCSTYATESGSGSRLDCSVIATAGHYQVCSALQVPSTVHENWCSAVNLSADTTDQSTCSTLQPGATKAACTTFRIGSGKQCSAFGPQTACSTIVSPQGTSSLGKCTALRQADAGSCSALPGTASVCSVIQGPAPTGPACGFH